MLIIYRRHVEADPSRTKDPNGCSHQDDPYWQRCRCPMWVRGTVDGVKVRESLKTRSWAKAEAERDRRNKAEDPTLAKEAPVTVADAVDQFLADSESRGCGEETLHKLRFILKNETPDIDRPMSPSLCAYATSKGVKTLRKIDLKFLREWRNEWVDQPLSKQKKQERVRSFLRFCVANRFITENPATGLSKIIVKRQPTLYFNKEEFQTLLDSTEKFPDSYGRIGASDASRLRTLMLLMRYSGLAIGDASTCGKKRLDKNGNLFLYRAKTNEPVYVPLPPFLIEDLKNCPDQNQHSWFWSGNGAKKVCAGNWRRCFRKLFKLADLRDEDGMPKRCHPHMFRDTFAVELLLAGTPIEEVAMLLGHDNIETTIESYSPWVKARQQKLTQSIKKMWGEVVSIEAGKRAG